MPSEPPSPQNKPSAGSGVIVFQTWSLLLERLKGDLASDTWRTMSAYSVAGRSVSYRSFDEFMKIFEFVKREAEKETGTVPRARTVACMPGWPARRRSW